MLRGLRLIGRFLGGILTFAVAGEKPALGKNSQMVQSTIACKLQVIFDNVTGVTGKARSKPRSGCPVNISLERFGDRWSLLIIRDLMVRGLRTFTQFENSGEGIASNILTDRLHTLAAARIVTGEVEETD